MINPKCLLGLNTEFVRLVHREILSRPVETSGKIESPEEGICEKLFLSLLLTLTSGWNGKELPSSTADAADGS
jgi:hypothetical protein